MGSLFSFIELLNKNNESKRLSSPVTIFRLYQVTSPLPSTANAKNGSFKLNKRWSDPRGIDLLDKTIQETIKKWLKNGFSSWLSKLVWLISALGRNNEKGFFQKQIDITLKSEAWGLFDREEIKFHAEQMEFSNQLMLR